MDHPHFSRPTLLEKLDAETYRMFLLKDKISVLLMANSTGELLAYSKRTGENKPELWCSKILEEQK